MEDLNQPMNMGSVNQPMPTQDGGSIKKIIWVAVGIIIILFIILAVLAVVGNRSTGSNELSEAEKQNLIDALEANPGPELTNEERTNLVEALQESAEQAPELSPAEKQNLLDALNQ